MAGQTRSSQPTIANDLKDPKALQAAVQPRGAFEYVEARPGYVGRNHLAGSGIVRLSQSLAQLDHSLIPVLEGIMDRKIEKEVTEGAELFAQNPDMEKNRKNWKNFSEEHPEYAGYNPHLQRGYEMARLKALAIDQGTAMEDAFVQSGMVNERDPAKVSQWIQQFSQDFRKKNELDRYEDRITLAANYSALEFQNRSALLNKHTDLLAQQQQFMDLGLKRINGTADPAHGGPMIGDPKTDGTTMPGIAAIVEQTMRDAGANGVLNAHLGKMGWQILTAAYEQHGENLNILELSKVIKTPNGVALYNTPGVAEKTNNLREAKINKARAAQQHAWAAERHQREMQKLEWTGQRVIDFAQTGLPATPENMQKAGVPRWLQPEFAYATDKFNKAQTSAVLHAPANQRQLTALTMLADTGLLNEGDIYAQAEVLGRDEAVKLLKANQTAKNEETKAYAEEKKSLANSIFSMFARNKDKWSDITQGLAFGFSGELTKEQKQGIEAAQLGLAMYDAEIAKYKQNNPKATPEQIHEYSVGLGLSIKDRVGSTMRERYKNDNVDSRTGATTPKRSGAAGEGPQASQQQQQQQTPAMTPPAMSATFAAHTNTLLSTWVSNNAPTMPRNIMQGGMMSVYNWLKTNQPDKLKDYYDTVWKGGR